MNQPCTEIERIVKVETIVQEHGKKLDSMDGKLDRLLDTVGQFKNNKSFVGGIAATGWLIGAITVDIMKPFAKPLLAVIFPLLK